MAKHKPRRIVTADPSDQPPHSAVHTEVTSSAPPKSTLPFWAMTLLSIFGVIHLLAVYAEPFRFSTQVESFAPAPDARLLRDTLRPYIEMMYLNHGYYFFAPNPGPAHLVVCVFDDEDKRDQPSEDKEVRRLVYPDKTKQKPRLLYHRYFMFTEFYNTLFTPQELPNSEFEPIPADVKRGQELYAALKKSLHHYFEVRHPRQKFEIFRVEHGLPSPQEYFNERIRLDDPRLYTELPERLVPNLPPFGPEGMTPQGPRIPYRAQFPMQAVPLQGGAQ